MKIKSVWAAVIGGMTLIATAQANAAVITYELVNASASFSTDAASPVGATSFTLNIGGRFTYDTTNLIATSVDITLSGPIPALINEFEAFNYTTVFTGIGFTGAAFSAINPPGSDVISLRFLNPLGNSVDPLTQLAPAFMMISPAFGFTATSVTGFADPHVPLPATLPLFVTGLGALGLIGWRRRRSR